MNTNKDENYSKGMWIAGIVLAVVCISFDICALTGVIGGENDFLKQSAYFSLPLCLFVLYKCIMGLKKKIQEEG